VAAGQVDYAELVNLPVRNLTALKGNTKVTSQVLNTLSLGIVHHGQHPCRRSTTCWCAEPRTSRSTARSWPTPSSARANGQGPAWQLRATQTTGRPTKSLKDFGYHPDQAKTC